MHRSRYLQAYLRMYARLPDSVSAKSVVHYESLHHLIVDWGHMLLWCECQLFCTRYYWLKLRPHSVPRSDSQESAHLQQICNWFRINQLCVGWGSELLKDIQGASRGINSWNECCMDRILWVRLWENYAAVSLESHIDCIPNCACFVKQESDARVVSYSKVVSPCSRDALRTTEVLLPEAWGIFETQYINNRFRKGLFSVLYSLVIAFSSAEIDVRSECRWPIVNAHEAQPM